MAQIKKVYITGDWYEYASVAKLAERFEKHGVQVIGKWWEQRSTFKANRSKLARMIAECDLYVVDVRSPNYATHKFTGSTLGAGMALAMGKQVRVLLHPDGKLSSLLADCTTNEDCLFDGTAGINLSQSD